MWTGTRLAAAQEREREREKKKLSLLFYETVGGLNPESVGGCEIF